MAAVEVTISGVLYDKLSRSSRPVTLIGEAFLTGLEVGGGPILPGGSPPGIWGPTDPRPGQGLPGQPPGIWGPTDPRPGQGLPGGPGQPPGIWGPTDPRPGQGLPTPPGMPTEPPPDGGDKPPPETGGWGYVADWSQWGYFPMEGEAQPKA